MLKSMIMSKQYQSSVWKLEHRKHDISQEKRNLVHAGIPSNYRLPNKGLAMRNRNDASFAKVQSFKLPKQPCATGTKAEHHSVAWQQS